MRIDFCWHPNCHKMYFRRGEWIEYNLRTCKSVLHKPSEEMFKCLTTVPKSPSKFLFFPCLILITSVRRKQGVTVSSPPSAGFLSNRGSSSSAYTCIPWNNWGLGSCCSKIPAEAPATTLQVLGSGTSGWFIHSYATAGGACAKGCACLQRQDKSAPSSDNANIIASTLFCIIQKLSSAMEVHPLSLLAVIISVNSNKNDINMRLRNSCSQDAYIR